MLPFLAPALSCFVSMILKPNANEEEYQGVTQNAVFGLGCLLTKIEYRAPLLQYSEEFPIQELSKLWFKKLPLKLDPMEVKTMMVAFCEVFERWDSEILANTILDAILLPDIMRVYGEVALVFANSKALLESPNSVAKVYDQGNNSSNNSKSDENGNFLKLVHPMVLQRMKGILMEKLRGLKGFEPAYAGLPPNMQAALQTVFN
jgi:hypothetical protein